LAYSVKHVGDVKARAGFNGQDRTGGKGNRQRWLKAEERSMVDRWAQQQPLDDYLLLKGLRPVWRDGESEVSGGITSGGRGCGRGGMGALRRLLGPRIRGKWR
jgi:hypothetical protein